MMGHTKSEKTHLPTQITQPLRIAALVVFFGVIVLTLWSIYAPLSTTLHASGILVSSKPSYEIQHPFGGEIANVAVNLHQNVTENQTLITLDVEVQKQALQELKRQISDLMFENKLISKELNLVIAHETELPRSDPLAIKYSILDEKLSQETKAQDDLIESNRLREASVDLGIKILGKRREQIFKRSQALQELVTKGSISLFQTEEILDDMLSLDGQINTEKTLLTTIRSGTEKAHLDRARVQTQHRLALIEKMTQNNIRLPEIRHQILTLRKEIESAIIRSPIDGTIVSLNFDTNQMYVGRGATVLKLSKRLESPKVLMTIPTQAIDQVRIGMKGKLGIPSLPQRDLPHVNVAIVSISPDALKDENQHPIGYQATGDIAADDLVRIAAVLHGKLHLSTDMPVTISLEGRKTTLYQYLIQPFFSIFSQSLQN